MRCAMIVIVNCPRCKKRFDMKVETPAHVDDEGATLALICPHCQHEFPLQIDGTETSPPAWAKLVETGIFPHMA
jgi:hypothetical protein